MLLVDRPIRGGVERSGVRTDCKPLANIFHLEGENLREGPSRNPGPRRMVRLFSLDLSYAAFSSRMNFRISERFQLEVWWKCFAGVGRLFRLLYSEDVLPEEFAPLARCPNPMTRKNPTIVPLFDITAPPWRNCAKRGRSRDAMMGVVGKPVGIRVPPSTLVHYLNKCRLIS